MKGFLLFIGLVIAFGISSYFYIHSYGIYAYGENDNFELNVGEKFTIKFDRNRSGECWTCWTNEKQCDNIRLVNRDAVGNIFSFFGFKGAGGIVRFRFEGIKPGVDTLRISSCCVDYPSDTLGVYGHPFVVRVEE